MRKPVLRLALAGALFVLPGWATAHDGATGIVKERMEHMKVLGAAMKALAPYIQGQTAFDAAEVARLGAEIGARGADHITNLFPKDSLDAPSAARPEIWQRWTRFESLADEVAAQAETLVKSASGQPWLRPPMAASGGAGNSGSSALGGGQNVMMGGPVQMPAEMAVRMNFMHLAAACKNCHIEFRQKKE